MDTIYNYTERQVGSGNQLVNALTQLQVDATGNYDGRNNLLASLLLPKQYTAMYPPTGRQQTNTKAVDIATLVAVEPQTGFTNDLMFVIPEESPVPFIHVFRRSLNGFSYFHGFIPTSESMQDTAKYRSSRLVSSLIEISSDTRPGGNFDISGQFNAITLAYLPPRFQSLDHNQLLKFKDTPAEVRTNVPILDGIAYRKGLTQENPLLIRCQLAEPYIYGQTVTQDSQWWRPLNYAASSHVTASYSDRDIGTPGVSGLSTTVAGGAVYMSLSGVATDRLPSLAMYTLNYSVVLDANENAQGSPVHARLYMRYADQEYIDIPMQFIDGASQIKSSNNMEAQFYAYSTIERVEIIFSSTAAGMPIFSQQLSLHCHLASNGSTDKQATVISVRGVPDGVTYSVAGRLNYEFIAGSELKADLVPEPNATTNTDLQAALRVQEYLNDAVSVGHVMTCSEYRQFLSEVSNNLFDRARHSRYAFLGAIMPALRAAVQYAPRILQMGTAAHELSRDLQAAYRDKKNQRRAMLGSEDAMSSLLPSRGTMANLTAKFHPRALEAETLPEAQNMRHAGPRFQITRKFATVDSSGQAEVGKLTVSTEALNKDTYISLAVNGINVHHQNYDFGDTVITQEVVTTKLETSASDLRETLTLYRDQEPLRTLAWMAEMKGYKDIYLTSSLEDVRGGSAGFTLEAIWYGFTDEYVYTGSSAADTTWLPSYPLGAGLEAKAQLPKIAAKTQASELGVAKTLGFVTPLEFDGTTYPTKVCVESSSWFMEMLIDTSTKTKTVYQKVPSEATIVYRDSQATLDKVAELEARVAQLTKELASSRQPVQFADYFVNMVKPEEQKAEPHPGVPRPPTVIGYPQTNMEMEDAELISKIIEQLQAEQIPGKIPESVKDAINALDPAKATQLNQYIDMVETSWRPRSQPHGFGIVSTFKAFLKTGLPMVDSALLLEGPGEGKSLADFLAEHNVPQAMPGLVTNAEYLKALASANIDKAVDRKKVSQTEAAKMKHYMLRPKPTQSERKKAREERAKTQVRQVSFSEAPLMQVQREQQPAGVAGGSAMQKLMGGVPAFSVDQ